MINVGIAAALLLPFIGALQRFAVNYGYRGQDWDEAWEDARRVFFMLGMISAAILAIMCTQWELVDRQP